MIRWLCILFGSLFLAVSLHAQYGFQKVYDHHEIDTISIISDVYLLGDSIYFSGGGRRGNSSGLRFGKVNNDGDLATLTRHDIPDHAQRAYYSGVDTDTNFRGNLVNIYGSRELDFSKMGFRLIEYDLDGNIIFDSLYYKVWEEDSLTIFDKSKLLQLPDSCYLANINYNDLSENGSPNNIGGTMLLKIKYTGEILWTKKFISQINPGLVSISGLNLIAQNSNSRFKLHYYEQRNYGPSLADLNWAKQHFLTLDENGDILEHKVFQDGQYCHTFGEAYFDQDTVYLQYFDSKLYGEPGNNDYFTFKPILAKISPSMGIVWRKELQNFWGEAVSSNESIQRIRKVDDTSFVGAHGFLNLISEDTSEPPLILASKVRLYNFSPSGHYNWIRDYYYYPIDSIRDPGYEISDLEVMPDGGYVLGGEVKNFDSLNQGKPGQFAYLLRTNCLGFLGPPQAALSYVSDNHDVHLINNSMSAGSYSYYFGDGDSLSTSEDLDSLVHYYENEGDYEVTLIAHGCNGEADTVKLLVSVELEEESSGAIGGGVFAIYPNPLLQGELITIETGTIENSTLNFYDMNGKYLKKVPLPDAKSIYFIDHNFASGVYIAKLMKDEEVLREVKLVVQ